MIKLPKTKTFTPTPKTKPPKKELNKKIINDYPWPPKELSPNARLHWAKKDEFRADFRKYCYLITDFNLNLERGVNYPVKVMFFPPNKKKRDLDNCLASCKSLLDGMCSRMGIDDVNLRPITIDWGDVEKDGRVRVEIEHE